MKPTTPKEYLEQAMSLGRKALDLDPENILAARTLGLAYLYSGMAAEAGVLLERTLESLPADSAELTELSFSLARAYCQDGQTDRAQACFRKALREKDPSPVSWLLTAWCLLDKGNLEAAARAFQKTAEIDYRLGNARSLQASACALLARYETAIETFTLSSTSGGPGSYDLCGVAACLIATGADEKALPVLEEAALLPPEKMTSLSRDDAARASSDALFRDLLEFHIDAAAKKPSSLQNSRRGADLLILRLAGRVISKLEGLNIPFSAPHRLPEYLKCVLYRRLEMHDKNIAGCQAILEEDSADPLAAHLLLKSNEALGTPNQAIGFYKEVLTRNTKDIGAALRIIDMYLELEDMDLALVYCRKALDIEPENIQANYNMGLILLRKDRAYAALPYLQKASELDKGNAATLLALGEAQAKAKNYPAAKSAWETVAENDTHGEWGRQAREKLAALNSGNGEAAPPAQAVPEARKEEAPAPAPAKPAAEEGGS